MRRQYEGGPPLVSGDLDPDPLTQLRRWLEEAVAAGTASPNAMLLASVDAEGRPQARFVLLRGLDERGLVFFTNYESAKARELETSPRAALTFGWLDIYRQVRVTGSTEPLSGEESDTYFAGRPRATQIGSWASRQSEPVADRAVLVAAVAEAEERFADRTVPRPPHWGGYLVRPDSVEFWQGQPDRLHDRLRYRRTAGANGWAVERLSP